MRAIQTTGFILVGAVLALGFVSDLFGQDAPTAVAAPAAAEEAVAQPAATEAAAEIAPPSPEGVFPSLVHKGDILEFLRLIGSATQKNIIPTPQVRGAIEVNLYEVTFKEALDAVLTANGFAYTEKGPFIYVYTQKEMEAIEEAARQTEIRVFQVNYVPVMDVSQMIKPLLSKNGQIAMSPEAGQSTELSGENWAGGNYLIVQDYPENLEPIAALIAEIDTRPPQVLVEATILVASLEDTNELGIDFNYLGGVDFETVEGSVTGVAIDSDGTDTGGDTSVTGNLGSGGLTIGITSNNVGVFLRALESVTDVVALGNPKVLTLNRQMGKVIVGNRDGYITTEVSQTTATQTVEFLETGTQLTFRPFVMNDGFIRMELNPKDSDGGVEVTGAFTLPSESTAEVTTNVLVQDGRTIVIGGLFRDKTTLTRSQVPLLGNVPILGTLFRSTSDTALREEVIFLITPHIVKEEVDYAAGEQVLESVFTMRNAARDGLQWQGRDSLAAAYYNWARQHLAEGELDQAIWDSQMAVHMSPTFMDAYNLRNELLNRQVQRGEIGCMRSFMRQLIEQ
ncbi:MAG: hypothetical protein JW810_04365 [Sedimentisphaerales bacterium]|nr:hypothetical protein [Sedimentisphaerales bacterium]